jgi:adenylate cyclase
LDTQLVEASTGANLWAGRFDRPLTDVLAVQDDVLQKIVATLNLQVGLSEHGILTHQNTDSLEAYDEYLRGYSLMLKPSKEVNEKARQLFEKAIALDPRYADPYVYMGVTYYIDWMWQFNLDPHTLERSSEFVRKALGLDDSVPYAHAVLSVLLAYQQHYDAAIAEANRAIALAPNLGGNYLWVAEALNQSGKPVEALEIAQKAMRVDPINRDLYLFEVGYAYLLMGRPQEAIPVMKRFLISRPGFVGGQLVLTVAYVECGKIEEARGAAALVMKLSPQYSLEVGPFKGVPPSNFFISDLRKAGLK